MLDGVCVVCTCRLFITKQIKKHTKDKMKEKKGFELRTVCGENILVAEGLENIDFSKLISMNETSTFLWQEMAGKTFTVEDMADAIVENYEIDRDTALNDCRVLAGQWKEAGIVED